MRSFSIEVNQMSVKDVSFRSDLSKDGYSKEEEYMNRMNQERIERIGEREPSPKRVLADETQKGSLRRFWKMLRKNKT
jgi:hypothetical protein